MIEISVVYDGAGRAINVEKEVMDMMEIKGLEPTDEQKKIKAFIDKLERQIYRGMRIPASKVKRIVNPRSRTPR